MNKKYLAIIGTIIVVAGLAAFWLHGARFVSTDDAFVEGRIIRISPKVSGTIEKLYVDDNQHVKQGDLLLTIDERDYKVNFNAAQARYSKILYSQSSAKADVKAAAQNLDTVTNEYNRFQNLYAKGAVSKQDFDYVQAKYEAAKASLTSANEKVFSKASNKIADADLRQALSGMQQAELELSYTKIYAPCDGRITNRSAEAGAFIHAGSPLFSIVPDERWIVANFKETQLENMKVGQPVSIKVDAYPKAKFKGKVDSIQASTGSKTSLFPPENAVGSYVKIVQRVPVKIVFTDGLDNGQEVVPGMSVEPKVKVK